MAEPTLRGPLRRRIRRLLFDRFNLAESRQFPFVSRRYPYRGRNKMLRVLGRDLASPTIWYASDTPPQGELAAIFADTPNIMKWSHYLPVYESTLATFRARPIRMLEIGVARGGSLQMWRRYLHPDSVLVGIDIDPTCKWLDNPPQQIYVRIGAQQDTAFLQDVNDEFGPFDVILDDGSHRNSHIVDTFRFLFPNALAECGVYIVEDIHANYWKPFRDSPLAFVDFAKWVIDAMHAHYQVTRSELDFRVGKSQRRQTIAVPVAAKMIGKVEFYDSIAVIHRCDRELPRSISQ